MKNLGTRVLIPPLLILFRGKLSWLLVIVYHHIHFIQDLTQDIFNFPFPTVTGKQLASSVEEYVKVFGARIIFLTGKISGGSKSKRSIITKHTGYIFRVL